MTKRRAAIALFIATLLVPRPAHACVDEPWTALDRRLARITQPLPLVLLATGTAAPLVLAPNGADQQVRVFAQRDLGGRYDAEAVTTTAPYALAAAVAVGYVAGELAQDCGAAAIAGRALVAMGITIAGVSALKIAVGRSYLAGPPGPDRLADDGRSTRFAPFENFGAWPSGHSAATFAFAAVMRTALPRRLGVLRYSGYALAALVSAGMMYGDHHWASDVLSGALYGEAVGRIVGAPLETDERAAHVSVVPTGMGIALTGFF